MQSARSFWAASTAFGRPRCRTAPFATRLPPAMGSCSAPWTRCACCRHLEWLPCAASDANVASKARRIGSLAYPTHSRMMDG